MHACANDQSAIRNTVPANGHRSDSIELEFDLCSRVLILFRFDVINHDHICHRRQAHKSAHTHGGDIEKKSKEFPESLLYIHALVLST